MLNIYDTNASLYYYYIHLVLSFHFFLVIVIKYRKLQTNRKKPNYFYIFSFCHLWNEPFIDFPWRTMWDKYRPSYCTVFAVCVRKVNNNSKKKMFSKKLNEWTKKIKKYTFLSFFLAFNWNQCCNLSCFKDFECKLKNLDVNLLSFVKKLLTRAYFISIHLKFSSSLWHERTDHQHRGVFFTRIWNEWTTKHRNRDEMLNNGRWMKSINGIRIWVSI